MPSEETRENQPTGPKASAADRAARRLPPGYLALWLITLTSVLLNVIILRQLLLARQVALQSVRDSIAVLEGLQGQIIEYTFSVDQAVPIAADIPIQETVPITIDDEFPINTSVTVSVPLGPLGSAPVTVPISTVVPIQKTFNITIDQTFSLETIVPVQFDVPIVVNVAETPLYAALEDTRARLLLLEQDLSRPLLAGPARREAEPTPTAP